MDDRFDLFEAFIEAALMGGAPLPQSPTGRGSAFGTFYSQQEQDSRPIACS